MGKNPAFLFFPKDWLTDTALRQMSLENRGIWIDCLCYMWQNDERGKLCQTKESMARMLGISTEKLDCFLDEGNVTKTLHVTQCNNLVTLINRRMFRDEKDRANTKLRVRKHRENRLCNTDVTVALPVPVPVPVPKEQQIRSFEQFWKVFPKKVGKPVALRAWFSLKPGNGLVEKIVEDITSKAASEQWTKEGRRFCLNPSTYLNQRRWEDEVLPLSETEKPWEPPPE